MLEPHVHSRSPATGLQAVLEDDGRVAVFYLHDSTDDDDRPGAVVADVFAYNRVELIPVSDVQAYRPGPPPIAEGFGGPLAVCARPEMYEWSVSWSDDGHEAVLHRDGEPWCSVSIRDRRGRSRAIATSGPWGEPWSAKDKSPTPPGSHGK